MPPRRPPAPRRKTAPPAPRRKTAPPAPRRQPPPAAPEPFYIPPGGETYQYPMIYPPGFSVEHVPDAEELREPGASRVDEVLDDDPTAPSYPNNPIDYNVPWNVGPYPSWPGYDRQGIHPRELFASSSPQPNMAPPRPFNEFRPGVGPGTGFPQPFPFNPFQQGQGEPPINPGFRPMSPPLVPGLNQPGGYVPLGPGQLPGRPPVFGPGQRQVPPGGQPLQPPWNPSPFNQQPQNPLLGSIGNMMMPNMQGVM